MLSFSWLKSHRDAITRTFGSLCVLTICGLGTYFYGAELSKHYAVPQWLAWHLLPLVGWTLLLNVSLVVFGFAALRRLLGRDLDASVAEQMVLSFGLGLTGFALLMYFAGAVGWYRPWFAVALPMLLLTLGARELLPLVSLLRRGLSQGAPKALWARTLVWLSTAFGCFMLGVLYLECLTPNSLNFDAVWYHVPIAQDYAREGRMVPFYGDNHRAYPHLTSLLHTWALLVPKIQELPARWVLMLHIEYSLVVWRIIGVAAVAQWLLGAKRVPGLWPVFFLFPSVFIYDQNIAGSADHVLGSTAAPVFLALVYFLRRFDLRAGILLGACAGCHILIKYQAVYLTFAIFVTVVGRALWFLSCRSLPWIKNRLDPAQLPNYRTALIAPWIVVGCALLVSGPHFLKNAIYYQNPLYPFANRLFPSSFDDWTPPSHKTEDSKDDELSEEEEEGSRGFALEDEEPEPDAEGDEADLGNSPSNDEGTGDDSGANDEGSDDDSDDDSGGDPAAEASDQPSADSPKGDSENAEAAGRDPVEAANSAESQKRRQASNPEKKSSTPKRKSKRQKEKKPTFTFTSRSYKFAPQGEWVIERLAWLHATLWDWSFRTGNRNLTHKFPYMGSLFTLLLPALFFVDRSKRLWCGALVSYLAFVCWGLTNANDRYLLAFMTIPIGVAAALIVRVWQLGKVPRLGLIPLVGLQFLWSVDAPFHYGDRELRDGIALINRGYSAAPESERFNYRKRQRDLTEMFPKDAVILGRYYKDLVGFDRTTLNTHRAIQTYVNFRKLSNTYDFWKLCRDRGITHLLYPEGQRRPHWLQDIILFDALVSVSEDQKKQGSLVIAKISDKPPENRGPLQVLVLGIPEYRDGLYNVRQLTVDDRVSRKNQSKQPVVPWDQKDADKLLDQAEAIYMKGSRVRGSAGSRVGDEFKRVERFGSSVVYLRKTEEDLEKERAAEEARKAEREAKHQRKSPGKEPTAEESDDAAAPSQPVRRRGP